MSGWGASGNNKNKSLLDAEETWDSGLATFGQTDIKSLILWDKAKITINKETNFNPVYIVTQI